MNKEFYILRYERTEYAKRIRKDYESKKNAGAICVKGAFDTMVYVKR